MRILITGGMGFIGANLIQQIIAETEDEVVNLDKVTYAANLDSLSSVKNHARYRFEKIDICDAQALTEVFEKVRPDAVMHLAAESHVDRSINGPGVFIQSNIVGTYNLLQASLNYWQSDYCEGKDVFRFHHVSTDEVYGSLKVNDPAFSESNPYDPRSPYSASKAASDHLVRSWANTYGLPVVISNCSNNYGPFQNPEKLIPTVILNGLRHAPIPVYGNGQQVRDWLHVDDHCRALRMVLNRGALGRTYNIGGQCELKNVELIERVCLILDELKPWFNNSGEVRSYLELITHVADRPGHDERYAIDTTRISKELGWTISVLIEDGLKQTVQWYLDHRDWWQDRPS